MRDDLHVSGTFVGITGRMSELQGAVAAVQLSKLDRVLADMRANFWSIRDRVSDLAAEKGVTWRRQWDKNGDASLALIFYLPDGTQARRVVDALRAEGLPAQVMFDPRGSISTLRTTGLLSGLVGGGHPAHHGPLERVIPASTSQVAPGPMSNSLEPSMSTSAQS